LQAKRVPPGYGKPQAKGAASRRPLRSRCSANLFLGRRRRGRWSHGGRGGGHAGVGGRRRGGLGGLAGVGGRSFRLGGVGRSVGGRGGLLLLAGGDAQRGDGGAGDQHLAKGI